MPPPTSTVVRPSTVDDENLGTGNRFGPLHIPTSTVVRSSTVDEENLGTAVQIAPPSVSFGENVLTFTQL